MLSRVNKIAIALLVVTLVAGSVFATNFVSTRGQFYVTYPDTWNQVDYNTVDYYLYRNEATRQAFQYEAVFASQDSIPFHASTYVIISLDSVGPFDSGMIDSVITELEGTFQHAATMTPSAEFLANPRSHVPNYDPDLKELTVLNVISEDGEVIKRNLWVMKFYDVGAVNFFCFSPDSLFNEVLPDFVSIVNSFSTENIDQAWPKEELKLSDVEPDSDEDGLPPVLYMTPALMIIAIVLIARRKKKKTQLD